MPARRRPGKAPRRVETAARSAKAIVVAAVLDRQGDVGGRERLPCIEHDRELRSLARAPTAFVGSGMRSVQDPGRVMRDAPRTDAAPRGELAATIKDEFVAAHRRVRIRTGDGIGMKIERTGNEAADEQ